MSFDKKSKTEQAYCYSKKQKKFETLKKGLKSTFWNIKIGLTLAIFFVLVWLFWNSPKNSMIKALSDWFSITFAESENYGSSITLIHIKLILIFDIFQSWLYKIIRKCRGRYNFYLINLEKKMNAHSKLRQRRFQ